MALVSTRIKNVPGVYTTVAKNKFTASPSSSGASASSNPVSSGVISFNGRTGIVTSQNGDYSTTIVSEGANLYYTDARAQAAISVSGAPLGYTNGVVSITVANGTQSGYVTSGDWTAFNNKLSDAPSDGTTYGRKNGAWLAITSSGSGMQGFQGNYSGGTPSDSPTSTLAFAVDISDNQLWIWFSSAWHNTGITLV